MRAVLVTVVAGCASVRPQSGSGGDGRPNDEPSSPVGHDAFDTGAHEPFPPPPVDFTPGLVGAYKRGEQLLPADQTALGTGPKVCDTITGVVRDFKGALAATGGTLEPGGHPDFEVFEGRAVTPGLVAHDLVGGKPVYTGKCELTAPKSPNCPSGAMTTSRQRFDQWYRSVPGVNIPFLLYFRVEQGPNGVSTFSSDRFFPVDGAGWGNSGIDGDKIPRNFSFTTEIHTTFKYKGGETFFFDGDDDVWVFVNSKLAVDLGGLHPKAHGQVDLDASAATLGIAKGSIYPLDLFHAERHSVESNFHMDLNFQFEDCGYVVP